MAEVVMQAHETEYTTPPPWFSMQFISLSREFQDYVIEQTKQIY